MINFERKTVQTVFSVQFAVLMWLLTYVGALFNGLTLLILGEVTRTYLTPLDVDFRDLSLTLHIESNTCWCALDILRLFLAFM